MSGSVVPAQKVAGQIEQRVTAVGRRQPQEKPLHEMEAAGVRRQRPDREHAHRELQVPEHSDGRTELVDAPPDP